MTASEGYNFPQYNFGFSVPNTAAQYKPETPAISTPQAPSPKMPGWGDQLGQFFTGASKLAAGVGSAIAAYKRVPFAGDQLMAQFGPPGQQSEMDPTEKLRTAIAIFREAGLINGASGSSQMLPGIKLKTGDNSVLMS